MPLLLWGTHQLITTGVLATFRLCPPLICVEQKESDDSLLLPQQRRSTDCQPASTTTKTTPIATPTQHHSPATFLTTSQMKTDLKGQLQEQLSRETPMPPKMASKSRSSHKSVPIPTDLPRRYSSTTTKTCMSTSTLGIRRRTGACSGLNEKGMKRTRKRKRKRKKT